MSGGPMKPPPRRAPSPVQHIFVRASEHCIVNVTHVRGVHLGDMLIQIHMTSGRAFYLKYCTHDEAAEAFEKLWGQLEHLRLPLE